LRTAVSPGVNLYQVRAGPVVSFAATSRLSLLGGYYFTQQERRDNDFIAGHRLFGGAEGEAWSSSLLRLQWRGLAERFFPGGDPPFNRYRTRVRMSAKTRVAPYAGVELFFDNEGYRSARISTGVTWRASERIQLDLGYFFEERVRRIGFDRHMFSTSLHFRGKRPRTGDPDL
jgi:hypothetical protein